MSKRMAYFGSGIVMVAGLSFAAIEMVADETMNDLSHVEGRLLVKMKSNSPDDALATEASLIGAELIASYSLVPGLALFAYDQAFSLEEALYLFSTNEFVEYAEPDYYYHVATTPNDSEFGQQWSLENVGQTKGVIDADINALLMWGIERGSYSTVVGVIDTGIDYTHQDLIPNLWHNALEIPGNNIDDDGNGYIDDVYGLNALTGSGNPFDDNSHGSHVSGIIGAKDNNGIGISGVSQRIQIAACKFLAANGSGSASGAITCLQYFASLKARSAGPVNIVATNNSWGGGGASKALRDAIASHENLGVLFIAAAGNSTNDNDAKPFYPAGYTLSNIVAVAATDASDNLASFSNYGKLTVHVGAPGASILSTVLNQNYAHYSGTSMAAPHVTGLAAIIKSRYPAFDYRAIKNLIIASGTPLHSLQNTTISGRRIRGADTNGSGALTCMDQIVTSRLSPSVNSISVAVGSSLFLSELRINCNAPFYSIPLYSDAEQSVVLQDNGQNGDKTANDGVYSLLWQPQTEGTYALNFSNGDTVTVDVHVLQDI